MDPVACGNAIAQLRAAIDGAAWPLALGHALEAWRAARAPALADLVDALATRCAQPARPLARDLSRWWIDHAA